MFLVLSMQKFRHVIEKRTQDIAVKLQKKMEQRVEILKLKISPAVTAEKKDTTMNYRMNRIMNIPYNLITWPCNCCVSYLSFICSFILQTVYTIEETSLYIHKFTIHDTCYTIFIVWCWFCQYKIFFFLNIQILSVFGTWCCKLMLNFFLF